MNSASEHPAKNKQRFWDRWMPLLSYVWTYSPTRSLTTIILLLLNSLMESVSLLMLIPILNFLSERSAGIGPKISNGGFALLFNPFMSVDLWVILLLFCGLIAISAGLGRFKTVYMAKLLYETITRMRVELFGSIAAAEWRAIITKRIGDLDHVLTGDIDRVQVAASNLFLVVQSLVFLCAYVALSAFVSLPMTLFATAIGVLVLVLMRPIRRQGALYGDQLTKERQAQYRTVAAFLGSLKVTKSYNAEDRYIQELSATLSRMNDDVITFVNTSSLGTALFQMLSTLSLCIFIYAAHTFLHFEFSRLIIILVIFMRISPRFTALQQYYQLININISAFEVMQKTLNFCTTHQESHSIGTTASIKVLKKGIHLKGISLAYDDTAILSNIWLDIPAGQITAIVGESGSGKSTLADIIMGLVVPDTGTILIDEEELTPDRRRSWRANVAYVPQDSHMLSASVADNLAIGLASATQTDMEEALKNARAYDFVQRLPSGLHTHIGDGGVQLSGGERQRLALARAFLRQPAVLILDEATSALDNQNTAGILELVAAMRGKMTILLITHSANVLEIADTVCTLSRGNIAREPVN